MSRSLAGALAVVVVAAGTGCGTERSVEAYCRVLDEQRRQYLEQYDPDQLEGLSDDEQALAGVGLAFGAMGDIPNIFDELSKVAPDEIQGDVEAVRDAFKDQLDAASGAAGDPLGAIVGSLFTGLTAMGPMTRVEQFTVQNCG